MRRWRWQSAAADAGAATGGVAGGSWDGYGGVTLGVTWFSVERFLLARRRRAPIDRMSRVELLIPRIVSCSDFLVEAPFAFYVLGRHQPCITTRPHAAQRW